MSMTTNNYYTIDSHDTTTTTTNNYYYYNTPNGGSPGGNTLAIPNINIDVSPTLVLPSLADLDMSGLTGDLAPTLPSLDGLIDVGDITGTLPALDVGDITNSIPVDVSDAAGTLTSLLDVGDVTGNVPVDVGDLTGGLPSLGGLGVDLGDVTGALPTLANLDASIGNVTGIIPPILDGVATAAGDLVDATLDTVSDVDDGSSLTTGLEHIVSTVADVVEDTSSGIPPLVEAVADDAGHVVDSLLGSVATPEGDVNGLLGQVLHDVGDIVASIAACDTGNPLSNLDLGGLSDTASVSAADLASAGSNAVTADAIHDVGPIDLSDVGALLGSLPLHDLSASHLDLDQLTSSVDLFDTTHVDSSLDTHHA